MRNLLNNSHVHEILSEAISDGGEAVADRYLHDFAHMTYTPQGDDELEVTVDHLIVYSTLMNESNPGITSWISFELDTSFDLPLPLTNCFVSC